MCCRAVKVYFGFFHMFLSNVYACNVFLIIATLLVLASSFFVGDSAGREGDFSCVDR